MNDGNKFTKRKLLAIAHSYFYKYRPNKGK